MGCCTSSPPSSSSPEDPPTQPQAKSTSFQNKNHHEEIPSPSSLLPTSSKKTTSTISSTGNSTRAKIPSKGTTEARAQSTATLTAIASTTSTEHKESKRIEKLPPPPLPGHLLPPMNDDGDYDEDIRNFNLPYNEYQYWMSKIEGTLFTWNVSIILKNAPYHIRNNKDIMLAAVQRNGKALEFASSSLQQDKDIVMAAVKRWGGALQFASPDLQNQMEVVMAAVKHDGCALKYVPPPLLLQNDNNNNKELAMVAVQNDVKAIKYVPPDLRNYREVVVEAVKNSRYADDGDILRYASSGIRNGKHVVMAVRQKKDEALEYVNSNPDNIKFISERLKRDPDILIAAGMYDENHDDAIIRKKQQQPHHQQQHDIDDPAADIPMTNIQQQQKREVVKKIVLSTRFALHAESDYVATTFTKLLKEHEYIRNGFIIYAPNAFDKKTCDPNWTNINHPCRGTDDTCLYDNVLTEEGGYPTDDCCWRSSFRNQLEEARNTGGFILQIVERERDHGTDREATLKLGKGQEIELEMSKQLGLKIFQVYVTRNGLTQGYVDTLVTEIKHWYEDGCLDMSGFVLSRGYRNIESYF